MVLTIPLFFSGFVFSTLIGKPGINISTALAYNLMGALFGGLMEYNSMYFGFAFLYLLAMAFYGLAWLFSIRIRGRHAPDRRGGAGLVRLRERLRFTQRPRPKAGAFSVAPCAAIISSSRPCRTARGRPRGRPLPSRS